MSMALEGNNTYTDHRIELPEFAHSSMAHITSIYNSPEFSDSDQKADKEDRSSSLSVSSTSSIGNNSDECSGGGDDEEVQSEYKGGPLDSLDALEEVLPVKKSISKFYCGKSKSFTSLSDAACSSVKDITKPENAYTRKRKNLLAFNNFWDKNHNSLLRRSIGDLSKSPSNSRSMLCLAATRNCSESNSTETSKCLPPLPPLARKSVHELSSSPRVDKFSSWRTFSLADLQGAATAATTTTTSSLWISQSNNGRDMLRTSVSELSFRCMLSYQNKFGDAMAEGLRNHASYPATLCWGKYLVDVV